MLTKRLIACFDIVNGMVTKAQKFQDNIDVAPARELAGAMYDGGVDEIIFYDIKASAEKRRIDLVTVKQVAERVFVPFTVGGGIKTLDDMYDTLKAGAEKISVDSMAVRNPEIITQGAKAFGSQCIVLSTQVKRGGVSERIPSGYEVFIDGAAVATGLDALEWVLRGQELGAGEVCLNSIDNDGMVSGYDLDITKRAAEMLRIPLIASGGAGKPEHLSDLFLQTQAQACIISSMLYSPRLPKNYTIEELKSHLADKGVNVRPYSVR